MFKFKNEVNKLKAVVEMLIEAIEIIAEKSETKDEFLTALARIKAGTKKKPQ